MDTNTPAFIDTRDQLPAPVAPIGPEAEAIAARIAAERERLAAEESIERTLAADRKRLIVRGSDAEVDEIEHRIDVSRSTQVRIMERVELLHAELLQANAAAHDASLDALEARANRARELGERLITVEYKKHATALVGILSDLKAIDALIDQTNRTFEKEGRDPIVSPENVRWRGARSWTERVTKTVGLNEPGHPFYGYGYSSANDQPVDRDSGKLIPRTVEIEVDVDRFEVGEYPKALPKAVVLGAVQPAEPGCFAPDLWNHRTELPEGAMDALIAKLDATPTRTPKSRSNTNDQTTTGDQA